MKIAVEGCAHGELEKIYECVEALQERESIKIDLLICCGDFQAVRNNDDLCSMAVPQKYQNICSFYKYYSGERYAPVLTLFIGGNHEASNYLQELPYGGWVAPNIYYLGRAGVVRFGGLRIGGLSGIYKGRDYLQGLWESPPYNQNSLRSVYHIRAIDVFRLRQLKEKVHVMLSHDWPRGIAKFGNTEHLFRIKSFLREEIESNQLGSMPAEDLLHLLKPDYWFAAHMHFQFAALVQHENDGESRETKFLALDKCLPRRRHLQILDLPDFDGDKCLKYDAEWLAILKNTNHLLTVRNVDCHMPGPGGNERYDYTPTEDEKTTIIHLMGDMIIKEDDFVRTAPAYTVGSCRGVPTEPILNPQTAKLCEVLGIDDPLQVVLARSGRTMRQPQDGVSNAVVHNLSTPQKNVRLSLPAPVTPTTCDKETGVGTVENDSFCSTDVNTSCFSDNTSANISDYGTPVSITGKKTFKRRNQALYTPDGDGNTANAVDNSESSKPTKLSFKSTDGSNNISDIS